MFGRQNYSRAQDPVEAARTMYLKRGWYRAAFNPEILGRFAIVATQTRRLPGEEERSARSVVLHTMVLNRQNLAEPEVGAIPVKSRNKAEVIENFPRAWAAFTEANPNAPIPPDWTPVIHLTSEQELGPMPATRTRIPWPGFTDDVTYGQLIHLNIDTLEVLAYATDTQVWHIGPEGPALREKAREWLKAQQQVASSPAASGPPDGLFEPVTKPKRKVRV